MVLNALCESVINSSLLLLKFCHLWSILSLIIVSVSLAWLCRQQALNQRSALLAENVDLVLLDQVVEAQATIFELLDELGKFLKRAKTHSVKTTL